MNETRREPDGSAGFVSMACTWDIAGMAPEPGQIREQNAIDPDAHGESLRQVRSAGLAASSDDAKVKPSAAIDHFGGEKLLSSTIDW